MAKLCLLLIAIVVLLIGLGDLADTTVIYQNGFYPQSTFSDISKSPFLDGIRRRCPLCDSSVYSYCSEKLFHDSCCCYESHSPYDHLPYECNYADCSFLHSNSCHEHKLISACCCTNLMMFLHNVYERLTMKKRPAKQFRNINGINASGFHNKSLENI